jgi:hypothetical protein
MIAGGLGLSLVATIGAWHFISKHRTHDVPVVEADGRPLRVKPDNPGGMQVPGQDETIVGGGSASDVESLAPTPEPPAPQALRDSQAGAAKPTQPGASASPPAKPPPVVAAAKPVSPAAADRSAAKPQPVQAPVAPAAAAASGQQVQFAALDSEDAARAEWERLVKRYPDLFGAHKPLVQKAERDGKTLYRLRTSGFADPKDAAVFCAKVKAKGPDCVVVKS